MQTRKIVCVYINEGATLLVIYIHILYTFSVSKSKPKL